MNRESSSIRPYITLGLFFTQSYYYIFFFIFPMLSLLERLVYHIRIYLKSKMKSFIYRRFWKNEIFFKMSNLYDLDFIGFVYKKVWGDDIYPPLRNYLVMIYLYWWNIIVSISSWIYKKLKFRWWSLRLSLRLLYLIKGSFSYG